MLSKKKRKEKKRDKKNLLAICIRLSFPSPIHHSRTFWPGTWQLSSPVNPLLFYIALAQITAPKRLAVAFLRVEAILRGLAEYHCI
jgi:hypothetical protein